MDVFRSMSNALDPTLARQRAVALAHHCRLGVETAHPRFAFTFGAHTVVLTVDSGYA